jgi:TRAP-type C4-dicarboxylate transport system permease small subunit
VSESPARGATALDRREPIGLRVLHAVGDGMNALGTIFIFVVMLLVVADILGRFVFNAPIPGVTELVSLSIVGIVFLQIASTLRAGRLTRSDAALVVWRVTRPRLAKAVELTSYALGATLMTIVTHASWPPLVRAYTRDEYVGALGTFTAPTWPIRLVIVVGSAVLALQFAVMFVREARRRARV